MQGYDFYELNDKYGVTLQLVVLTNGGNMTAGTELLRRKADKSGHVITVPLITDSTGKKSANLKATLSGLTLLRQLLMKCTNSANVMDDDAVRFLKIFTFLSLEEIERNR